MIVVAGHLKERENMKARLITDLYGRRWGLVHIVSPHETIHGPTFNSLNEAEAHCQKNGIDYEIYNWLDGFTPERAYASNTYSDELEYVYEVAP